MSHQQEKLKVMKEPMDHPLQPNFIKTFEDLVLALGPRSMNVDSPEGSWYF